MNTETLSKLRHDINNEYLNDLADIGKRIAEYLAEVLENEEDVNLIAAALSSDISTRVYLDIMPHAAWLIHERRLAESLLDYEKEQKNKEKP